MSKLLSAASAIGLLLAVNAAQAAEVITDEQMDTVTAGVASAAVVASVQGGNVTNGTFDIRASNTSATVGSATAVISGTFVPVGIAPHTFSLAAAASAP
jgi:hypothetical protein